MQIGALLEEGAGISCCCYFYQLWQKIGGKSVLWVFGVHFPLLWKSSE